MKVNPDVVAGHVRSAAGRYSDTNKGSPGQLTHPICVSIQPMLYLDGSCAVVQNQVHIHAEVGHLHQLPHQSDLWTPSNTFCASGLTQRDQGYCNKWTLTISGSHAPCGNRVRKQRPAAAGRSHGGARAHIVEFGPINFPLVVCGVSNALQV